MLIAIASLFQANAAHAQTAKDSTKKEFACPYVVLSRISGQPKLIVPNQPTGSTFYANGDLVLIIDGAIYYCITYRDHDTVWLQKDVRHAPALIYTYTDPEKNTAGAKTAALKQVLAKN